MNRKFLLIFTSILSTFCLGQKFTSSPYSAYGLGETGSMDNANFIGLGNNQSNVIDSLNLNYQNPSSYSFLGKGQPLFSLGISYKNSLYSENNNSFTSNIVGINHFAFAVPFRKNWGLAFGIKPFSRVGYSISDYQSLGSDTVNYTYRGAGTINDAFTGLSYRILNKAKHQLGIGVNFSYLFGSTTNERISQLSTQNSGGIESKKIQVKSFYYTLGMNYQYQFTKNQKLTLGVTYNPLQDISTTSTFELAHSADVNNSNVKKDTIFYNSGSVKFTYPNNIDFGFAYQFRPKTDANYNKTKIYQLTLFASHQQQKWQDFSSSNSTDTSLNLANSNRTSIGIEFIPHYQFLERSKSIPYLSRLRYRAGIHYSKLPYTRNNSQLTNSGITFGLSLPIISQRSVSSINFGFSYGSISGKNKTDFNEKYLGINVGITIAPGAYDKWFKKYKID